MKHVMDAFIWGNASPQAEDRDRNDQGMEIARIVLPYRNG